TMMSTSGQVSSRGQLDVELTGDCARRVNLLSNNGMHLSVRPDTRLAKQLASRAPVSARRGCRALAPFDGAQRVKWPGGLRVRVECGEGGRQCAKTWRFLLRGNHGLR